MQFKLFSVLALAATFVAADEVVEKKRDLQDDLNSIGADIVSNIKGNINGFASAIGNIPPDVASALATAIPTPTGTNIQAYVNSLVSDVNDGTPPAWYTGLPDNAKSFISSKASELASVTPTVTPTPTGNYAPGSRPTGAIVGGLVGAAGVLGLAVLL
ncbi:hypothetical protein ACJ72_01655 [Emergomyces africanus]|uniref:Uncharacterized protein n=1 Tax=Emergomyces africanus TaxID=1955775 RepID=A0A1B7P4N7_9EURO|nr:hypothetical protein ACJ72_01655 [Emergomyces africanus]